MRTAVAFIVFNRPEVTARVLAAIRAARPSMLFVIADGPRAGKPGEAEKCAAVRALVEAGVDWPCEVRKNYSDKNLGCGRRVSSGLNWVFEQVEEAIILEDDCLPDATFFPFCEELLERYRDDERVAQISGCTYVGARVDRPTSYLFSRYGPVWGWATWRRAWRRFDLSLNDWPRIRQSELWRRAMWWGPERKMRECAFEEILEGRLDSWAHPWCLDKLRHEMLSVISCVNLVENIGFGPEATHTKQAQAGLPCGRMRFPLSHPPFVRDEVYDRIYSRHIAPGWFGRKLRRLRRLLDI